MSSDQGSIAADQFEIELIANGSVRLAFTSERKQIGPRIILTQEVAGQIARILNPDTRHDAMVDFQMMTKH